MFKRRCAHDRLSCREDIRGQLIGMCGANRCNSNTPTLAERSQSATAAIALCSLRRGNGFLGRVAEVLGTDDRQPGLFDEAFAFFDVGAGETGDDRDRA